jgi:hypothetical protein
MVASVGWQGSFAGDASKPFAFRSKEWTRVLTKQEKKKKIKPIVEEEDFEIMPQQRMARRAVNFVVAPEGNNLTTHAKVRKERTVNDCLNKKKKVIKKQKEMSKAAFEKIIEQIKRHDNSLEEVNKSIAVSVKMLQEQLTNGIKTTKLQRELQQKVKNFEIGRIKAIYPLRKTEFERNFKVLDEHVLQIGQIYEKLDKKCNEWKRQFKQHNMDFYHLSVMKDTIPRTPEPLYVDPFGYTDYVPPDEMNDIYEPFPVQLKKPSSCHKCRFVGHHRKCPSPRKNYKNHYMRVTVDIFEMDYAKEAWNNQYRQGLEEGKSFNKHDAHAVTHSNATRFQMEPKANRIKTHFKSTCTPYAHEHEIFDKEFHDAARKRSEHIFNETWNTKREIRAAREHQNIPFTRIERAFMATATAVSETTEDEMEKDEIKANLAAIELRSELKNVDVNDVLKEQQLQIDLLLKELEQFKKGRQNSTESTASHHSTPIHEPPKVINTAIQSSGSVPAIPADGEISYTMQTMLEKYESLDEDSRNELFKYAISTGNEHLQSRL